MALRMTAAAARAASLVGGPTPYNEANWCLHWCARTVYGDNGPYRWGGNGKPWAINFFDGAARWGKVVKTADPNAVPNGAMTFSKGSAVYGHVYISDGKGGCYTTDYPKARKIGHVKTRDLLAAWGHKQLGYILVTGSGVNYQNVGAPAPAPAVTVWDQLSWNVAYEKWFTPWSPRQATIGAAIRGDASINDFQEVYSEEQVSDILRALGGDFARVGNGGPGLERMYDRTRWDLVSYDVHRIGPQGRGVLVSEMRRKATGKVIRFGTLHAPALYPNLRTTFGQRLRPILAELDVLTGDFNTSKNNLAPRKDVRAAGFRDMREQASVKNGGMAEFPSKDRWLADMYSKPGKVKITYGELQLTSAKASDHRELTARMEAR